MDDRKVAAELIALLDEHREAIADAWLDAIREQMPDARYSRRPPEEIRTNNLSALAMLRDLLQGRAPDTLWERRVDAGLTVEYVKLGIDISEVVMAALLLEYATHPILTSTFSPDTAEAQRARLELRRHVHLLARDLVRGYAVVTSQHLREEQQRTALMLEMARTVGESLDLAKVLSRVVRGIAAAVGVQHCILYLVGDDGQTGKVWAATEGLPSPAAERLRASTEQPRAIPSPSLASRVLEEKRPLACFDAQTDPRTNHELMTTLGFRSVLEVPFVLGGQVLAIAIVVTFDECRVFTEEQIELALGIANAVAPAIENARLYQRVEQLAVLEERARLAREIHDDVAQVLGALQLKVSLLDELLSGGKVTQARASLPELQDMISEAYTGVRESVFNLRAVALPTAGFLPSLQEYLADYRLHYSLDVSLEADVDAAALLDGNTSVQVIRIIQEALTNARRHARAGHAWVRIERLGERVCVIVEDDGWGFDPSGVLSADQPHFGLQVMHERAEKVCGRLAVDSRPGAGTRVALCLPGSPGGGQP